MVYVDYNVPLFSVKHAIITFLNISFNFNLYNFSYIYKAVRFYICRKRSSNFFSYRRVL